MGSVKEPIVKEIELTRITPSQFVPCHPISGSEKSGPQAADGDLFDGCTVLTPSINTGPMAQQACADFWQAMGASVVSMSQTNDAALAVTSHLPHLLAFAFMGQVTDQHLPPTAVAFATLRIAAANPISGGGSCSSIKGTVAGIDDYADNLREPSDAIASGDESRGLALIEAAAQKRRAADCGAA